MGQKAFIAELMPRHPLYVDMLPDDAKAAIGIVHPNTRPAYNLLLEEGLRYKGYIDILMVVQRCKQILKIYEQLKKARF